jgi:hypothetical protein
MMEAKCSLETLIYMYRNIQHHITEDYEHDVGKRTQDLLHSILSFLTPWSESASELHRPSDRRFVGEVIANCCG